MTNYLFKYEPLYVARAETPVFDERFIGFGMTRNTQVWDQEHTDGPSQLGLGNNSWRDVPRPTSVFIIEQTVSKSLYGLGDKSKCKSGFNDDI